MRRAVLNKKELFTDKFHFIAKGEQRMSTTLMMWNTCEHLRAVKQQK